MAASPAVELSQADTELYQRVEHEPHFFVDEAAGALRLAGETRLDFLQRQSTNNLNLLPELGSLVTVLTSPTAKILDVLVLIDEGESILMLPLPGRTISTAQFLRSRIFFMDRVTVADVSGEWAAIEVGGQGGERLLDALGLNPGEPTHAAAAQGNSKGGGHSVRIANRFPGEYLVLMPQPSLPAALEAMRGCGAVELTREARELLRVENGIPGASAELTEDFTPLEAGLTEAISSSKGCYTGQEVIARQLTYDKVVQKLVGLRADQSIAAGSELFVDGRRVGRVTSVAHSPRQGWIALGYVRRPENEAGRVLSLSPEQGGGQVTVV